MFCEAQESEKSRTLRFVGRMACIAEDYPERVDEVFDLVGKVVGVMASRSMEPTVNELLILRSEGKIRAILAHRARTMSSLKESKDAIEKAGESLGLMASTYNGNLQVPVATGDDDPPRYDGLECLEDI